MYANDPLAGHHYLFSSITQADIDDDVVIKISCNLQLALKEIGNLEKTLENTLR